jgi:hypothetical protein
MNYVSFLILKKHTPHNFIVFRYLLHTHTNTTTPTPTPTHACMHTFTSLNFVCHYRPWWKEHLTLSLFYNFLPCSFALSLSLSSSLSFYLSLFLFVIVCAFIFMTWWFKHSTSIQTVRRYKKHTVTFSQREDFYLVCSIMWHLTCSYGYCDKSTLSFKILI